MITVVFRYDDFSARSDSALEKRLIDLFKKYQLSCVFGVVPFVCGGNERNPEQQQYCGLPPDKVALLRDGVASGTIEPALHGYHHQNYNPEPDGRLREFAGLAFEEQLRRLRSGKEWLEQACGKSVVTFIPPFNAYDRNTLSTLQSSGFRILSAAMFDEAVSDFPVALVPHTCSILQLREALEQVRRLPASDTAVIPLFHPFDFVEADRLKGRIDLGCFEELLVWLKGQPDIETRLFSDLKAAEFTVPRFFANRSYLRLALHPLALPWWQVAYPRTQYLPEALSQSFRRKMSFSAAAVFFGIGGGFLLLGMAISHTGAALPIRFAALATLLMLLLICALLKKKIYFKAFVLLLALSGVAIGSWL